MHRDRREYILSCREMIIIIIYIIYTGCFLCHGTHGFFNDYRMIKWKNTCLFVFYGQFLIYINVFLLTKELTVLHKYKSLMFSTDFHSVYLSENVRGRNINSYMNTSKIASQNVYVDHQNKHYENPLNKTKNKK